MTFRQVLRLLWVAGLSSGAAGCGAPTPPDPRPNVLLVTLDTTRADHTSAYGYARETTPELAALALEGARFAQAYSPSATTAPSHLTIFTSLYPLAHGVLKNGIPYDQSDATIAELFSESGYQTAAVVSSFVLSQKFGYGRGFDSYDDDLSDADVREGVTRWEGLEVAGKFEGRADDTTRRALRWLEGRDPSRPFLLFVHYYDPHDPYAPPVEWSGRFLDAAASPEQRHPMELQVARYDAEIAFVDHQLGRMLDGLVRAGVDERTLVVVAGDHGEGLMQHGHMYHGLHVYEEAVRVPLLLRFPAEIAAGQVIDGPVQLIDLTPTILDLVGIHPDETFGFQGKSLAAVLRGDAAVDPDSPIFLHRRHYTPTQVGALWTRGQKYAIRKGRWKYIEGPEEGKVELFDLVTDPGERRNLRRSQPDLVRELAEHIAQWRQKVARPGVGSTGVAPEDSARLEALGYVE